MTQPHDPYAIPRDPYAVRDAVHRMEKRRLETIMKGYGRFAAGSEMPAPPTRADWLKQAAERLDGADLDGIAVQNVLVLVRDRVKRGWRQHGKAEDQHGNHVRETSRDAVAWSVIGALDCEMHQIAVNDWLGWREIALQVAVIAMLCATSDPPGRTLRQSLGHASGNVTSQDEALDWILRARELAAELPGACAIPLTR